MNEKEFYIYLGNQLTDRIRVKFLKEKRAIEMPDLNTAFAYARQDIEDRWNWYKDNYISKMQ